MNRKRNVAIATAAFAAMAPAVAQAKSLDGLYTLAALFFLPPFLSLIAGCALSTYLKAAAAGVIVSLGGILILIWGGLIGAGLFHISFLIVNVLIALAAHGLWRWLHAPKS